MGKISPVSIKYMIYGKFSAEGAVEKPDVIGALFGQTEGLLGAELELRELQKEGKIGRIEVNLQTAESKTTGEIQIPTCLDKSETTIIAAAIETIDRIGPTEAKIAIEKIEDVRGNKRDYIIERAKQLLEKVEGSTASRDISDSVKTSARMSKLQEYGDEKLPAGDISGSEIIIVEGRADVINLLKNGVSNVICMNGTKLPEGIKSLSLEKETTLFIDGDRGGELIAKNVIENAKIDYVAIAPDGKEVEELASKEILIALRKKIAAGEFLASLNPKSRTRYGGMLRAGYKSSYKSRRDEGRGSDDRNDTGTAKEEKSAKELTEDGKEKMKEIFNDIKGTKNAVLLNSSLEVINRVSLNDLQFALRRTRGDIYAVVMDGTATSTIIRVAEDANCQHLVASNFAFSGETKINLMSF
ncbi:MAG TPA: DNA primase DnaG [Candidatus Nanoarchaeia archaeon]|nr:DNA primase DnaG [Candidatus Nanoarchaeia archaeon]